VVLFGACTDSSSILDPGDGYERAVADLDRTIVATLDRAQAQPTSWTIRGEAAELYRSRARLSGDWSDYAKSQQQLDLAFATTPEGAGPFLAQASLDMTLHRLSALPSSLEQAERTVNLDDNSLASILMLRAQSDMLTDGYVVASERISTAMDLHATVGGHSNAARLAWVTGDFDTAHAEYDAAEGMYFGLSDEPHAWFHLQRGLMDLDRGRYDDALAHYLDADAALPGYWLVHEHIAEALWAIGDIQAADTLYADVVTRTGAPDLQDTYAEFLLERGQEEAASQLLTTADASWEARIAAFPDAAYGHAVSHYLLTDPERAVLLAEAQLVEQPSAAARTTLASALFGVSRVAEARAVVDLALATEWRHADTFDLASQIYAANGDTPGATALCQQARAINPTSECED
jgi:tetratricopeptide (TPR) repeat protein